MKITKTISIVIWGCLNFGKAVICEGSALVVVVVVVMVVVVVVAVAVSVPSQPPPPSSSSTLLSSSSSSSSSYNTLLQGMIHAIIAKITTIATIITTITMTITIATAITCYNCYNYNNSNNSLIKAPASMAPPRGCNLAGAPPSQSCGLRFSAASPIAGMVFLMGKSSYWVEKTW